MDLPIVHRWGLALARGLVVDIERGGQARDYGVTTEVATLLTFWFGGMTGQGNTPEAAAAVVTTIILGAKPFLHHTLARIEPQELSAILQLLLLAVVVLPLLPNRSFGPGRRSTRGRSGSSCCWLPASLLADTVRLNFWGVV